MRSPDGGAPPTPSPAGQGVPLKSGNPGRIMKGPGLVISWAVRTPSHKTGWMAPEGTAHKVVFYFHMQMHPHMCTPPHT